MRFEHALKRGLVVLTFLMGLCLAGMGVVAIFGTDLQTQDRLLNLACCWTCGFFPMMLWYRLRLGSRLTPEQIKFMAIAWPATLPILLATGKLKRRTYP